MRYRFVLPWFLAACTASTAPTASAPPSPETRAAPFAPPTQVAPLQPMTVEATDGPAPARQAPPSTPLTSFTTAEMGRYYHLTVEHRDGSWTPTDHIDMPFHHATAIQWLNLAEYPALQRFTDGHRLTFVFAFEDRQVEKQPNRHQWWTTYRARIAHVELDARP